MHERIIAHLLSVYSARYSDQRWSVISARIGDFVWESVLYMNGEALFSAETRGCGGLIHSCMSRGWSLIRSERFNNLKEEAWRQTIDASLNSPAGFNEVRPDHLSKSPLSAREAAELAAQLNGTKWPSGVSIQYYPCGTGKLRISWKTTLGTDVVGGVCIEELTQTASVELWGKALKIVGWAQIKAFISNLSEHVVSVGKETPVGRSMMGLESFTTSILSVKVGYGVEDEWAHTTVRLMVDSTAPNMVLKEWVMKNWSAVIAPQLTDVSKSVVSDGSEDGPRRGLLYPTPRAIRIGHAEIDVIRENGLVCVDIHESVR